jgi:hypothetical protein
MWLRHALKLITIFLVFSACSPATDKQAVDKLNSLSYAYHYRSLDSTQFYARKAFQLSTSLSYRDGMAEALNNLAFVSLARMRYEEGKLRLDSIPDITDNQIELFVSYVQQMRLCQRRSNNREFYSYRELARRALARIDEERSMLDERQKARLLYAESELSIVESTYYYYVGLERQSVYFGTESGAHGVIEGKVVHKRPRGEELH